MKNTVYSYAGLMERLIDLPALTKPPSPGEKSGAVTCRSRSCRYDEETDTYIKWSVKNEPGAIAYEGIDEHGRYILMEEDGPGVIWRFWTVAHGHYNTVIRVYLDEDAEPVVEATLLDFFTQYHDDLPVSNFPLLHNINQARGSVSYFPLPYQTHIRVTATEPIMYQLTYSRFPEGSILPDYRDRYRNENTITDAAMERRLERRGQYEPSRNWQAVTITVPPGRELVLYEKEGAGVLHGLRYYPDFRSDEEAETALRGLILSMYWDGRAKPAVWSPLGDFFGTAPGLHLFRTIPTGMSRLECYSEWVMPYGSGMRMELENRTDRPQTVRFEAAFEPLEGNPDSRLRFHAKWHPREFLGRDETRFLPGGDRYPDWPILLVKDACGRFCGMSMHVYNDFPEPKQQAAAWWYGKYHPDYECTVSYFWGEGREKFFVDGEKEPSTFGTGTEDYIGYAFSAEPPFSNWDGAFAAAPNLAYTCRGHISHCRFQIPDNIPFQKSFEAYFEKYSDDIWTDGVNPAARGCCYVDVVSYWYQQAGTDDEYPAYPHQAVNGFYRLPAARPLNGRSRTMKRQLLSGLLCLALLCGALFLAGCKTKDPAGIRSGRLRPVRVGYRTDGRGNGGERRADGHHPAGRSGQQRKRIQPNRARDDRHDRPYPAAAGSGEGILPGHGERQGLRGERGWRGRRYRGGAGGDRQGLRGRRRVRLYACRDLPPERREHPGKRLSVQRPDVESGRQEQQG